MIHLPLRDRRSFLTSSAALMLSAATARAGEPRPDDPVRVAVVGTGARGSDLVRALSTIEAARIVAVCDDYEPHLDRGREYAGPQASPFRDFEGMLDRAKPDAIVIATPLFAHYTMAMAAVEFGCAVFIEKTMCGTLDQARRLTEAVEVKGTIAQVGLQRRSNAIDAQAEAMVRAGMLGKIVAIRAQWTRNDSWRRPIPVSRDHPDWPRLERQLNWRLYRDSSRGLMAELASHQLDAASRILGTPPKRAIGSGGIDHWRDGREVFDNVSCVYDYEVPSAVEGEPSHTVRVSYASHQSNAYEGASELVMGTKGTLFLTAKKGLFYRERDQDDLGWSDLDGDQNADLLTAGKTLKMSNDPWAHRGQPFEIDTTGDDTRDSLVSFLDCVLRGDQATPCTVRDGLLNTATILIGDEAMRTGNAVAFPDDLG